jgi:GTP-binding protein Era
VDAFLLVLAADERLGGGDRFVAERVFSRNEPVVIALSKVDRLRPADIAARIEESAELGDFHSLHPVSAKTGDGVEALKRDLVGLLPEGPRYFEEGTLTDLPLEEQIAELVREQALAATREELPHAISVEVEELGEDRVRALVYVETESQKGIVVGKGGRVVKEIGTKARPQIERLVGRKIFLELQVKVRPHWRRDERVLERLGI